MTQPVRLGVIGAGRWGRRIIEALVRMPEVRLSRVASTNPATAALVPAGCRVEPEWRSVAAADDLDGVVIASPARCHAEMATVALTTGRAVLVEKPMALDPAAAEALAELARSGRRILHVDHVDVWNPAWRALRSAVRGDEVTSIEATFGGPGPVRDDVAPRWDWGCHAVALCIDLVGPPATVRARPAPEMDALALDAGVEEVEIDLELRGSVTARITAGNARPERARRVRVTAGDTELVYDDNAPHKLVRSAPGALGPQAVPVAADRPLDVVLARFARAVGAGAPDWEDAELGRRVVEVLTRVDEALDLEPAVVSRPGLGHRRPR